MPHHENPKSGGLAQLGERLHGMQEVIGSSPLSSTFKARYYRVQRNLNLVLTGFFRWLRAACGAGFRAASAALSKSASVTSL